MTSILLTQAPPTPTQNQPINDQQPPLPLGNKSNYRSVARCLALTNLIYNIFAIFALIYVVLWMILYFGSNEIGLYNLLVIILLPFMIILLLISSTCVMTRVWTATRTNPIVPSYDKTNNRGWLRLTVSFVALEFLLLVVLLYYVEQEQHIYLYMMTALSTAFRIVSIIFIDGFHQELLEKYPPPPPLPVLAFIRGATTSATPDISTPAMTMMPNEMSQYQMQSGVGGNPVMTV